MSSAESRRCGVLERKHETLSNCSPTLVFALLTMSCKWDFALVKVPRDPPPRMLLSPPDVVQIESLAVWFEFRSGLAREISSEGIVDGDVV